MGEMKPKIEITAGFPPQPGPPQSPSNAAGVVPFFMGRVMPGFASSVVAQAALGGHRAVTVGCRASDADKFAGISHAGAIGEPVDVVVRGLMEEGSWNWTPAAPVFIGAAGVLTQTPSTTGLVRRIAWAVSATMINVDIMPPVMQA